MSKLYKFDYIQDPSHGWLKVPIALLERLGIDDKITPFSYMRGKFAYLEEDNDMSLFINLMRKLRKPYLMEGKIAHFKHSKIRSYQRYQIGENHGSN